MLWVDIIKKNTGMAYANHKYLQYLREYTDSTDASFIAGFQHREE